MDKEVLKKNLDNLNLKLLGNIGKLLDLQEIMINLLK